MIEELVNRIKSIPPLPKTFFEIEKICKSPDGTIAQLSKVVERDPMLIANLLKIVNSSLYGLGKEINSVSQAVSVLGMKEVYSLAAVVSIKKLLKVDMEPYGIEPEKFALLSNMQGSLVKNWLKRFQSKKADTLFMPALLQETGKIIIADKIIRNDEVFQFKSEIQNTINVAQVERIYVDTTSTMVTAKIFEHWGFEDFIVNIIKYADNYEDAPQEYKEYSMYLKVIKTAVAINSPLSERSIALAANILKNESMDVDMFLEAIEKTKEDYGDEL